MRPSEVTSAPLFEGEKGLMDPWHYKGAMSSETGGGFNYVTVQVLFTGERGGRSKTAKTRICFWDSSSV